MVRGLAILAVVALVVATCGVSTPEPGSATAPRSGTPPGQSPPATSSTPGEAARVTRVVGGDTLKALVAGRTETVRVIGIDTPESVKLDTPIECFALRASAEAKRLQPVGAAIRLESDPTQAGRDQFGRLLAHVWLADGTLYAERMIRGGFGIHFVYGGVPSVYAGRLAAAEAEARSALRGLWSLATCAGNEHTAAP